MASVHSSVRCSRRPPSLRQRCPRPQSARRMKRVSGRRENARRKKRGGSLTPVASTPRLQVRKQTPSPSSPRARATHGDRDSSGGSFRKLKRVQTRPAVQRWSRRLSAGPPTPRMKRVFGRRENARRKNRGGSLTPAAQTPRLPIRKQTPSPSSPRARATHGDRDSSGGSFRKLKRVQTRPAVQHWSRRLSAGPPTPGKPP